MALRKTGRWWNGPFWFTALPFMILVNGVGSRDALDMYWYNNAFAEGEQMYPSGIHKYYDIFSLRGYFNYLIDWLLVFWIIRPLKFLLWPPFSFFPLETWIAWFTKDLSNWYNGIVIAKLNNMFFPFGLNKAVISFFDIPLERGFSMG